MPTNLKLIAETVKLGRFKSKQQAVNTALEEYVHRRKRLEILKLAGQIDFDPDWDYKTMRGIVGTVPVSLVPVRFRAKCVATRISEQA